MSIITRIRGQVAILANKINKTAKNLSNRFKRAWMFIKWIPIWIADIFAVISHFNKRVSYSVINKIFSRRNIFVTENIFRVILGWRK